MLKTNEIERIAYLARLDIAVEDIPRYQTDLSGIIDFVEKLGACDTTEIEPMAHPLEMKQRLRVDRVTEADERARFQSLSPQVDDGFYLVPQVIE